MKILLNPKYQELRPFLEHLEEHFERDGKEIHRGRNVIRTLVTPNGLNLVVKRYGKPSLRRRLALRLYKTSKAKVAFTRPELLRERGFESPESVAVVRIHNGLLRARTMYYVSLLSHLRNRLDDVCTLPPAEKSELIEHFAHYVARLHQRGVLHRDLSSSNILYDRIDGKIRFALVDTNHVRLTTAVTLEKGCRNLAALTGDEDFFNQLAKAYAKARKADETRVSEILNKERNKQANA